MKEIKKNELYGHLSEFLKSKGVELHRGSYARRIQQGCGLLTDTINLSQKALDRARKEMDKGLARMRQVIRPAQERTQSSPRPQTRPASAPAGSKSRSGKAGRKRPAKAQSARKRGRIKSAR